VLGSLKTFLRVKGCLWLELVAERVRSMGVMLGCLVTRTKPSKPERDEAIAASMRSENGRLRWGPTMGTRAATGSSACLLVARRVKEGKRFHPPS